MMRDFQGSMNTMTTNSNQIVCQGENRAEKREIEPLTCEICIDLIIFPNRKFENSNKCSHKYCTNCITNYIKAKLKDHKQGDIKCPYLNCSEFLDPISCRRVIGSSLFVKWCDVLCESAIVGVKKSYCPHTDCNALILDECGDDRALSQCPDCKKFFCFECNRAWKQWHKCDGDDAAFRRLAKYMKWRSCPRCGYFIERRYGCRSVKCRCGFRFCYHCGESAGLHCCRKCDYPEYIALRICVFLVLLLAVLSFSI